MIVFIETLTYCRTSTKWMNGLRAVVKCDCNCLCTWSHLIVYGLIYCCITKRSVISWQIVKVVSPAISIRLLNHCSLLHHRYSTVIACCDIIKYDST